ncbi:hypothetical protein OU787_08720 [Kitasatospora sp. YST-16]|uniref:hypothetical protein n=1 Tax=Kitasatospora sp. YST-16 TaxID=2998080 RepID=UPI002284A69F|nr:hypothetical protein [Kitasatospora sp. YST-16]WAL71580.1 hypothetical protein OU787_08720 [Kitasatospora sp. YST-16]WNW37620.1 hypothetical protein RKE32_08670 [Streptomyces sp. Li-HN-5-13]
MRERPQLVVTRLLRQVVNAEIEVEVSPTWLLRPGRVECAGAWEAVSRIYAELTGLALPEHAPPRERRRLDVVLTHLSGRRQVLEVDERQHFTAARATSLEHYPPGALLGFEVAAWLERSRELSGREPGGGFARPRPPLFPGDGGRHRQRAFRDALADLLPPEYGWLPTIRISDTEAEATAAAVSPIAALTALLAERGIPDTELRSA